MSDTTHKPEQDGSSISMPVIVATAIFALAAIAVVGFLLSSRTDDSESPVAAPVDLDLAAPLFRDGSTEYRFHLIVAAEEEAERTIGVGFTQAGDMLEPYEPDLEGVDLALAPLTNADEGFSLTLLPGEDGQYWPDEPVDLRDGWWETTVTMYSSDGDVQSTIFYLLLPDPNLHEVNMDEEAGDTTARGFYDAAMAQIAANRSIKFIERLTSGQGMVSVVQREMTTGNGETAAHSINAQFELLTIGDRTFQRVPGGEWFEREFLAVYPFNEWAELYEGGTDFELAEAVMVNGRPTQIITFFVPGTELQDDAWYAWWVDVETGYMVREAMVSTWHYMIYEFGEFNQPLEFAIPIADGTPVASPVGSPVSS